MKEIELINKRKRREKHFLQPDGRIIAKVYQDDIHYKKETQFEEIDNTLIKRKEFYQNRSNEYKVYFKTRSNQVLMKLKKNRDVLEVQLPNCNDVEIKKERQFSKWMSSVSYREIFAGVDLEYQVLPSKVKETIILKDRDETRENFTFLLKTNLVLALDNGNVVMMNADREVFRFELPYMIDSMGQKNTNLTYQLQKLDDGYELELVLDSAWLLDASTTYPVYIDPTITNTSQEGTTYDTYIFPNDTGLDKNNQPILKAGVEKIDGVDVVHRTLIKFDLPEIGTDSEIIGGYLSLLGYGTKEVQEDPKLVTIHRITKDWTETDADWNTMHDQYDQRVEAIHSFYRSRIYVEPDTKEYVLDPGPVLIAGDITNLVKKWYTDTPNYGIMLKSPKEVYEDENYPAFYSKNALEEENGVMPRLVIVYRNQNGLEDYLHYEQQALTEGSLYTNTYNGNLTGVWPLASTIGGQRSVSVNLIYNTSDAVLRHTTAFGRGYKLNLDQTIKETTIDQQPYLEYLDDDGTIHYFYKEDDAESKLYYDEDGLDLKIQTMTDRYIMTDKKGNEMTFTKQGEIGYLTEVKDVSGDKITIVHDSNHTITKVIDANQAELNFTYEPNQITITSPDAVTKLHYVNQQPVTLETITGITTITYNQNQLISSVTDVSGLRLEYTYYSEKPYRIQKVAQYGLNNTLGNYFTVHYGFHTTKIVDHKGRVNTLVFNASGNVVSNSSLTSEEDIQGAYSNLQRYGEDGSSKNKLLSQTIPAGYIKNYLQNTSFEREERLFTGTSGVVSSFSTECAESGKRSLKLESSLANEVVEQTISVPKGKHYTFSGSFQNDHPIRIALCYQNSAGEWIEVFEPLEQHDSFSREDITIYYDETATSDLKTKIYLEQPSTIYLDDIQLEEGEVANNYNMIENSDFSSGYTDWTIQAMSLVDSSPIPTEDLFEIVSFNNNQNKALKVNMDPMNITRFSKDFPVNGKQGDLYHISFWYKNEGIPADDNLVGNNVSLFFTPLDGSELGQCIIPSTSFPPNEKMWQYFSYNFIADHDYEAIKLIFNQGRNANHFYITNLSLYKDLASNFYEYDVNGNVIGIKDTNKENSSFHYDQNNQLIASMNPKGKRFRYEYDNEKTDRLRSAISSRGISNRLEYDTFGNPILTRIAKRGNESLTDDVYKIRNKGTDKYLKIEKDKILIEQDSCSNTEWILERVGEYFKLKDRLIPDRYLAYIDTTLLLTTGDHYNQFALEKRENGSYYIKTKVEQTSSTLIPAKYLKATDATVEFTTLVEGDPSFEFYFETTDPEFFESRATYSADGRFVTSVLDSRGNKTLYETDPVTGLTTSMTDPKGQKTTYTYNEKRDITAVTTGDKNVTYTYNENNLLEKIHQGTKDYKFVYDTFLNTKNVKIGDVITLVTNEYEEKNGNLKKLIYGNNQEVHFTYDEFDRIKETKKMDDTYRYKYDRNGELAKIISNDHYTKYRYDVGKRLNEYRYNQFKVNYTYDSNDNITEKRIRFEDTVHHIANTFDPDDLCTKMVADNTEINYQYDSLGRIIDRNLNQSYHTLYHYLSYGKKTTELIESIQNGTDQYRYKYDAANNITHLYHNGVLEREYTYDVHNRLIKDIDHIRGIEMMYSYDNSGNLLTKITTNLETSAIIKTDSYFYQNSAWEDQLTKFNEQVITYDAIGNPLSIGNDVTLSWINGRSLSTYTDTSKALTVNYKYNEDGIRIAKTVNGVESKYFLEGNDIVYEQRGNDLLYYLYDISGLIGLQYNNDIYYYVKNLQGDIIGLLDANHNPVATYEYDSWGSLIAIRDSQEKEITDESHIAFLNPFRYRSYYYDTETELYYLNARYYNSQIGRFLNSDSYGGQIGGNFLLHNIYVYCLNNPVSNYDKSGFFTIAATYVAGMGLLFLAGVLASPQGKAASASLGYAIADVFTPPTYYLPDTSHKAKEKAKSKEHTKTKPMVPYSNKPEIKRPCTPAKIQNGDVVRGEPRMTVDETYHYVMLGRDVMCDDVTSALLVAGRFKKPYYEKPHKNGKPGYYPHYHPWDGPHHPHIWFYPTP